MDNRSMVPIRRRMRDRINRMLGRPYPHEIDYWGISGDFDFPDADIKDLGKELEIKMDLPGVEKEDIRLNMDEDFIEVRAEKEQETEEEKDDYYTCERSYKGFYRKMPLPQEAVPEKARAKYEGGVLTVTVPKADIEKSQIRIE